MNLGTFHKMHGLGNDFIIVDERYIQNPINKNKITAISNRNTGIGCDQFIILKDSDQADIKMQIYNSDGSIASACGNASRCVVALLDKDISIETDGGFISGKKLNNQIQINMGKPLFEWQEIPLAYAMDNSNIPIAWENLCHGFCVNVGNPHIIFFVKAHDDVDLHHLGPIIENDNIFPEQVNINIAVIKDNDIVLHVWERGAGLTQACGTGACATAVAAISKKLVASPVNIILPGGMLNISWDNDTDDADIFMRGDAVHVFKGETDWDSY